MRTLRENCIILDTSILPKRPCISDIKTFLDDELHLDMSLVRSIQPHNVKNVVYLGMQTKEAADRIASTHHLKHFMSCDGEKNSIPLPIYVESSAVDVRVHDLPDDMDNIVIVDHMRQYGEVITIRSEVWKSYFPGFSNGVRVIRMKLINPIPSYITVNDEVTLVSYRSQIKTCRNCGRKSHAKQRCSEVAVSAAVKKNNRPVQLNLNNNNSEKIITTKKNKNVQPAAAEEQWPSLPKSTPDTQQHQSKRTETKRQRSTDLQPIGNEAKKSNANDSNDSDSSSVILCPDICPLTQRPYKIPVWYEWIEDEDERRAQIEEYKRKKDASVMKQSELEENCI